MELEHFNHFMERYADYIKSDSIQKRDILESYFTRWSTVTCGNKVQKAVTMLDEILVLLRKIRMENTMAHLLILVVLDVLVFQS